MAEHHRESTLACCMMAFHFHLQYENRSGWTEYQGVLWVLGGEIVTG